MSAITISSNIPTAISTDIPTLILSTVTSNSSTTSSTATPQFIPTPTIAVPYTPPPGVTPYDGHLSSGDVSPMIAVAVLAPIAVLAFVAAVFCCGPHRKRKKKDDQHGSRRGWCGLGARQKTPEVEPEVKWSWEKKAETPGSETGSIRRGETGRAPTIVSV